MNKTHAGSRPIEVRELAWDGAESQTRLVSLLAAGLERYLQAQPNRSLTPSPTVCLYDGHGDDEAAND